MLLKDKSIPYHRTLDYFFGILNPIANVLKNSDAKEVFDELLSVLENKIFPNKKMEPQLPLLKK